MRTRVLPGGYYDLVYFVEPAVDAVLVLSVNRRRSTLKKEEDNLEDRADKEYDLLYIELHAGDP